MHVRIAGVVVLTALILGGCGSSNTSSVGTQVTARAATGAMADPNLTAAVATYRTYLDDQTSQLVVASGKLRDAIAAGDLAGSRAAYIVARPIYEHIASPAEKSPALALEIDSQPLHGDVDPSVGIHKIQFGLWSANSTEGLGPTADKLVSDVMMLRDKIAALPMDPIQMTDAYEQLVKHPVLGSRRQEPYSQLDLLDHEAQVVGSRVVFDALRPAIEARSRSSATEIEGAFANVAAALAPLQSGGVWVPYADLTLADKRQLSEAFGVLSSTLSIVASLLKQPPL